jgi:hypothetical protein
MRRRGPDSMVGFCEHCNEPSGSMKCHCALHDYKCCSRKRTANVKVTRPAATCKHSCTHARARTHTHTLLPTHKDRRQFVYIWYYSSSLINALAGVPVTRCSCFRVQCCKLSFQCMSLVNPVPVLVMKARRAEKIRLHSFLLSELDADEQINAPATLALGK